MRLLTVDFETQCADAKKTNITEVGFFDGTDFPGSFLCWEKGYPPQTLEIVELTGITDRMLWDRGQPRAQVIKEHLLPALEKADVVMAHNVRFDRTVLESTCERLKIALPKKEWICSVADFPWPKRHRCLQLSHLAFEHDLDFDRASLHRAGDDAALLYRLVTEKYNPEEWLAYARAPWVYLKASVCTPWTDQGVQTGIAKSLGFTWQFPKGLDKPEFPGKWVMRTKVERVAEIREAAMRSLSPFRVDVIPGFERTSDAKC